MTSNARDDFVLVHADESCLGNQNAAPSAGGAAAVVECRAGGIITRRDLYISSPDTTNNRMALSGAIALFDQLAQTGRRFRVRYVSDSQYLVKGITEWIHNWRARGWRRKTGAIENLELWKGLDRLIAGHQARFQWVRGHAGHPMNEYADFLAVGAATSQLGSDGFVESRLGEWLASRRAKGQFLDFDPDLHFATCESRDQMTA